jgi:hypothetical protein
VLPGTVARVVERGDRAVSEVWEVDEGWVEAGSVRSVLLAPPASRHLLDSLGIEGP